MYNDDKYHVHIIVKQRRLKEQCRCRFFSYAVSFTKTGGGSPRGGGGPIIGTVTMTHLIFGLDPDQHQCDPHPTFHFNADPDLDSHHSNGISNLYQCSGSEIRDGLKIKIRIRDEHPGSYFRELRNHFLG
jgi:hypothetical protein